MLYMCIPKEKKDKENERRYKGSKTKLKLRAYLEIELFTRI